MLLELQSNPDQLLQTKLEAERQGWAWYKLWDYTHTGYFATVSPLRAVVDVWVQEAVGSPGCCALVALRLSISLHFWTARSFLGNLIWLVQLFIHHRITEWFVLEGIFKGHLIQPSCPR